MAKTNPIEAVKPHLATIQQWVDENITEDVAMPSKEIGARLSEIIDLPAEELAVGFRGLVKSGDILGIAGRRKVGFCRPGYQGQKKSSPAVVDTGPPENTCVELSQTQRIYAVDARNWALQTWNGSAWLSQAYWSTLDQALRGVARRMVNRELRIRTLDVKDLNQLSTAIQAAENNVLASLQQLA